MIICYNASTNKQVKYINSPTKRAFTALNFSKDGTMLIAASKPSNISYWDFTSKMTMGQRPMKFFKAHKSDIVIVLFSPN